MSKLRVDVEVDSTRVASGLNSSKQAIAKWAGDVKHTIAGAFGGAAIAAGIRATVEHIDAMSDSADSMGRTIQEVQLLAQMAKMAGKELGNVELMLNNISEAQISALEGDKGKMDTFSSAGFNEATLSKSSNIQILEQMAKAFAGKSIPELRNLGITDIVGKRNVGTFAAMQGDLGQFSTKLEKGQKDGSLMKQDTIDEFKQNMDAVSLAFDKLMTILSKFLPLITFITNVITSSVVGLKTLPAIIGTWLGDLAGGGKIKSSLERAMDKETQKSDAELGKIWEKQKPKVQEIDSGPGSVLKKKPEDPFGLRTEPDKQTFKGISGYGDTTMARGNFMGSNLNNMSSINFETNKLLKEIVKYTKKMAYATSYNQDVKDYAAELGIFVK